MNIRCPTNCDYLFKYIIIGDAAVGKSNLLLRYSYGKFNPEYQLTMGVEFSAKNVEIRNKIYRIQIWDTAGQENFRSITRAYYKNSACALVVYDISSRKSFNNVDEWIGDCKSQSSESIFMVLVGNKSDLSDKREVSVEEGKELAEKYGILFYETSAKDGTNVEEIFINSASEIARRIDENYYDLDREDCGIKIGGNRKGQTQQININKSIQNKKKSNCC